MLDFGWLRGRNVTLLRLFVAFLLIALIFRVPFVTVSAYGEDRNVRDVIRDSFYGFCETIDISSYDIKPEELSYLFSSVIKDDPYLFFVDTNMTYSFTPGGYVLTLRPTYSIKGEEVFFAWEYCREWVRSIAREAEKFEDDGQKATYLHDRLCLFIEYDQSLESDDLFDLLLLGRGTCQAYTQAYTAVLRECGIEAHFVASDSIEHIWNCLLVDGEWYHADLTWDDSASVEAGKISRRHLLLSDRAALERGHRDWYSSEPIFCDSERFTDCDFDLLLHSTCERGDINHDGEVTLADLLLVRKKQEDRKICGECSDLDGDGDSDNDDIALMRKKILVSH